ncbi:MAG: LamG-like jellyroll fold domain-containing protein [Planctomycetota bacterium]
MKLRARTGKGLFQIFVKVLPAVLMLGAVVRAELPEHLMIEVRASGRDRELNLHKYSIRAQGFRVRLWHQDLGYVTHDPPEVATYRGTVTGEPNTRVCAVIKPIKGLTVYAHAGKTPIFKATNVGITDQLAGAAVAATVVLGAQHAWQNGFDDQGLAEFEEATAPLQPSGYIPPLGPVQRAQMAMDVANEKLLTSYAGDWTEAVASLEYTLNRYDDFMVRDTKMSFEITEMVIRMDEFYDYESGPLKQVKNHWSAEHSDLDWDFVGGFITPKNWPSFSAGGVAYVPGKYFINVLFHENGHNLSAIHHLYGKDCMNGNRNAHWAALSAERVINRRSVLEGRLTDVAAPMYPEPVHPYATPDLATTLVNQPVDIDVLANDWDGNEDAIFIHSFTQTTVTGGMVALANGMLRYTPPADYTGKDLIVYTVQDATGLHNTDIVRIEVINQGLTAHWEFEQINSRNAVDSSRNGHRGRLPQNYESVPGVRGNAVKIPANSSMICDNTSILPPAPEHWVKPLWHSYPVEAAASNFFDPMNTGFTLAFWFKAASFGDSDDPAVLFDKANKANIGYAITADPNGIYFKIREWGGLYRNKKLTWNNRMSTRTWYHVVMVINRDDDTVKVWVDGQRVARKITLAQGSFICAGRNDLTMSGSKEVTFDEVHIFTKPLTEAEIMFLNSVRLSGIAGRLAET